MWPLPCLSSPQVWSWLASRQVWGKSPSSRSLPSTPGKQAESGGEDPLVLALVLPHLLCSSQGCDLLVVLRNWGSRAAGSIVLSGPHPGWPLPTAHPAVHAGYSCPAAGQVGCVGWEDEGFEERTRSGPSSSDPGSLVRRGCGLWTERGLA